MKKLKLRTVKKSQTPTLQLDNLGKLIPMNLELNTDLCSHINPLETNKFS